MGLAGQIQKLGTDVPREQPHRKKGRSSVKTLLQQEMQN